MKNIKPYNEVKVGDLVYNHPDGCGVWDSVIGKILWKGTTEELLKSSWAELAEDWRSGSWENDEELRQTLDIYDLIIVRVEDDGFLGSWPCIQLYNYNGDPSGAVAFDNTP